MPTLGTVYDASPVADVRYGSTTWQYGFVKLERSPPAGTMAVLDVRSGTTARTSQASVSRRPVLVPPCTVSPNPRRALTVTSTPCQLLLISCPVTDASSWRLLTWPTVFGFKSERPLTVYPPPPGNRGSSGAAMPYEV